MLSSSAVVKLLVLGIGLGSSANKDALPEGPVRASVEAAQSAARKRVCCNRQRTAVELRVAGIQDCWALDGAEYKSLCTIPSVREWSFGPEHERLGRLNDQGWCGPVCSDQPESKDRLWEATRNVLVAELSPGDSVPERLLLPRATEA
ncbi:unnamed protein product, partial [Polarella glacialis]